MRIENLELLKAKSSFGDRKPWKQIKASLLSSLKDKVYKTDFARMAEQST